MRHFVRGVMLTLAVAAVSCGQKGPPLAPLRLVPSAPPNLSVKRVGDEARLRFDVPSTNANGPGTLALDRIEVYAATIAPGAGRPSNRELFIAKHRVATIAVKPPPVEGEGEGEPENAKPDSRPAAGERTSVVETLTGDVLAPVFTKTAVVPAGDAVSRAAVIGAVAMAVALTGPAAEPAAAVLAPLPVAPINPVRLYTVRGVTKGGRPGPPAGRVELPLVAPPPVPPAPAAVETESSIVLTWIPPVTLGPIGFNVYKAGGSDPINASLLTEPRYERAGVEFGTEECFVLRSVEKVAAVDLESASSESTCITPRDKFPPAAPKGLAIVAGAGSINLSWDANKEPDLAGYLVLRGEVPGDTLQPLTPAAISGTSFEDKTVTPGVRYVYAVVAIDKASPPNRSAQSPRVEETAR
jgi:hypothetical protein